MTNFKQDRVDQLLQYILAVAGQEAGWGRELGMIHLIKYVYLADLSYAKYHDGQTYTGLTWIFHHFGPWSVDCYKRIDPSLESIGATKKTIQSDKHGDFIRWSADDYGLFDKLNNLIDLSIAGSVQKYVRKFGNDTYSLLDFVYKTKPMLNAAPEDVLEFMQTAVVDDLSKDEEEAEPTARQRKKRRQKILDFKTRLNINLDAEIKARQSSTCPTPPRYDDVFYEGLEQLDQSAGNPPDEGEYLAVFNNNVWKSKARHDPEIS